MRKKELSHHGLQVSRTKLHTDHTQRSHQVKIEGRFRDSQPSSSFKVDGSEDELEFSEVDVAQIKGSKILYNRPNREEWTQMNSWCAI